MRRKFREVRKEGEVGRKDNGFSFALVEFLTYSVQDVRWAVGDNG